MTNTFREDELVTRRMRVGNEWETRTFPIIGGRLRLAHEGNERLSIQTEIMKLESEMVVAKAIVETDKGRYSGTGTASAQRDSRLADALVELAETRSIARALRFGGIGVEYCGAEEVSHVPDSEGARRQSDGKQPEKIFPDAGSGEKPKAKSAGTGNGNRATQAQVRALYALSKRSHLPQEELDRMLSEENAVIFEELTVAQASRMIQDLQSRTPAA